MGVQGQVGHSATPAARVELTSSTRRRRRHLSPRDPSRPLRTPPPTALLAATRRQPKGAAPARCPPRPKRRLTSHLLRPTRPPREASRRGSHRRSHGGGEGVDVDPAQPGGGGRGPRGPGQVAAAAQLTHQLHAQGPDLAPTHLSSARDSRQHCASSAPVLPLLGLAPCWSLDE